MIDLSVLVCSVHTRYKTFGLKIQDQLWNQYAQLYPTDQDRVEILILTDNKKMMLGDKRNQMVALAQGKYIVFVDDDDRVEPDYISSILDATDSNADVITFQASVSLNGSKPKICQYSKNYPGDFDTDHAYHRLPNHICAVKHSIANRVKFPSVVYGEDIGYSKALKSYLHSEHSINRVLYHYDYNAQTSEHQEQLVRQNPDAPVVDVVMLSNATSDQLFEMTQAAIDSCVINASAPVNVIVMEQTDRTYQNAKTIYAPEKFNFNAFANRGIKEGSADWVMVANNDLVFEPGWLSELLAAHHPVVSPANPLSRAQMYFATNQLGYTTGLHFSGWCFMMQRKIWEQIGGFDDFVDFWCSDDVVIEQLKAIGVTPMLVPSARVQHIESQTLTQSPDKEELQFKNVQLFIERYGSHVLEDHQKYKQWIAAQKLEEQKTTDMKIGFAVVGHFKRQQQAEELAAKLDCKLYLDDGSFGEWSNHERAWRYLSENFDYGIVLQDDCLPIDNFVEEACAAVRARPTDAISFYTGKGSPTFFQSMIRNAVELAEQMKLSWLRSQRIFWGPCIGLPTSIVNDILDAHEDRLYDEHIGDWCQDHQVACSYTWPSLVEHADGFSVVADSMPPTGRVAYRVGHQIDPNDSREACFYMIRQQVDFVLV